MNVHCSNVHTNVHCSTVYSKDLESTKMPIDDRLDWENVAHIHYGIPCSHKNNEFVSFVETWMNLEFIVLSKLTQEEKTQTLHIFTHRQVMNNENTWTQGGKRHTLGSVVEGQGRDSRGVGRSGRDNMGRNAKCS